MSEALQILEPEKWEPKKSARRDAQPPKLGSDSCLAQPPRSSHARGPVLPSDGQSVGFRPPHSIIGQGGRRGCIPDNAPPQRPDPTDDFISTTIHASTHARWHLPKNVSDITIIGTLSDPDGYSAPAAGPCPVLLIRVGVFETTMSCALHSNKDQDLGWTQTHITTCCRGS